MTLMLPTVVSSWLDVLWVVDHSWYTREYEKPSSVAVLLQYLVQRHLNIFNCPFTLWLADIHNSCCACVTSSTTLDSSDLEYVNNYKYLGVWLDCKLSFQTHIKHRQSKIKSIIGFLFRNKTSFTHAAKLTLVKLTILPILDFSDVIYKIAYNTLLSKLDAVFHSASCFVTKYLIPPTTATCRL